MTSVSNPPVSAAHQAKKLAKSTLPTPPTGDGAEFGNMFMSMQLGLQGQDLAAQTGKASPSAAGLASEVLGPAVHIITSTAPTMDDDSLLAFARSQGMDESSLALIFQHAAGQSVPAQPLTDTPISEEANPLSAFSEQASLDQQAVDLQAATGDDLHLALPEVPVALEPTTDANGMSVLDLGTDGSMRWSVNQPVQVSSAETTKDAAVKPAHTPAIDIVAATTAAQLSTSKSEPANNLAASLILGAGEAAQFSKRLEAKQIEQRSQKLAAITGGAFKSVAMTELASLKAVEDAPAVQDTLSLGTELTGEDLQLIWAHRQHNAENSGNDSNSGSGAGQTNASQTETELRADQYAKLSQRLGEALGQRLAAQIAKGDWNVELTLKPQDLGNIEIKLNMNGGNLEASFSASVAMTRDLIVDGLPRLKETLAQSGMEVAQLNVNVGQQGQNGGKSTPERQKASTAISGVSKSSPVSSGLPAANLTAGKSATDNNGLDVLV